MPMLPNGMGYVWNALKPLGINMQVLDLNVAYYHAINQPDLWRVEACNDLWTKPEWVESHWDVEIDRIARAVATAHPKLLGISASETSQAWGRALIHKVRELAPDIIVLVGGYSCEYHEAGLANFPDFDYMAIREAELTLPLLVDALLHGQTPRDLPGVISRHDAPGRVWCDAPVLTNVDAIPYPQYEWTDIKSYPGATPIMMSRGCGWGKCHFCSERFAYRLREPSKVAEEMAWLRSQGRTTFVFGDSSLSSSHEHLMALCNEIIAREIGCWFTGQYHADKYSSVEAFSKLRQAGCGNLAFGVDGWCDHTLRLQLKSNNIAMIKQNLMDCTRAGVATSVNMVIGVPGETEDDITESIANIISMRPFIVNFQNLNNLILSAGSDYYAEPEKYGIKFRADKAKLYREHPASIPEEMWYSEEPYIDHKVRQARRQRIAQAVISADMNLTPYARWQAKIN